MPGPYPSATEMSYAQPNPQWQSLYATPISSSISSQRNYTRGHPPSRSRSLPRSLHPSPGSPISHLSGTPPANAGICVGAGYSSPRLRADIPSGVHSSLFGTSPRMVHPPSVLSNNGMFPNSPHSISRSRLVAPAVPAEPNQVYSRAEMPSAATPAVLNLPSNSTDDSPSPIQIFSPSSFTSTQQLRQSSDRISGNQTDVLPSPAYDRSVHSPAISQQQSTLSNGSHRSRPIPLLRLSSSVSLLRQATARLCRPRHVSTSIHSATSIVTPPPVPGLPSPNITNMSSAKSRKGIPDFTSSCASSGSASPRPSTFEERLYTERRLGRRLPRPENLTPGEGFDRCDAVYFSLDSAPGVRLKDLLARGVIIDDPNRPVFTMHRWRSTLFAINASFLSNQFRVALIMNI
jgi:hypothetical protein